MVSVEFWPVDDTPPAIILSNRAITLTHLTFAGRKYRQFCRKSELVFPRPGSVAPTHRAEMAERRVKILRPGLENPEAGLEKPKPGLGTAKVWAEKKGRELWLWLPSFCYSKFKHWNAKLQIRIS